MLNRQEYDYYDEIDEQPYKEKKGKHLMDITIGELMGEEFEMWLGKNKLFGYLMEVENEEEEVSREKSISPAAIDNFARTCRQFLFCYDRIFSK